MSQTKAQLLNPLGDLTLNGTLIGVGATFSGNVSIAGTLTKQDVTNVDSVGVVTARSGVNISGGNLQFGGTNVINSGLALYNLDSIKLADSKELKLGSSDDLKIYHNGSHSYINELGLGALKIKGDDIRFENQAGAERLRIGTGGGGGSIGINTTNNMVTNSEVLAVYGTSSFKSAGNTRPALYLGNEGATPDTANPLIIFNQDGANRGGIGYVPNTGELRFNNQYFISFTTGSSTLAGTERLRIGAAGQIGIAGANYGNAGQVITSGGSGSAISWADAASGAEYAGIASGSIAAGDSVIVHPDGKLSTVKYSYTASTPVGMGTQQSAVAGTPISNANNTARQKIFSLNVGVGATFPKVLNYWMDESNSRGYIRMGEVKGDNLINWGSTYTYMGTNIDIVSQAAWDPINKIGFMVYQDNSGCSGWAFREYPGQPNNIQLRGGEINLSGSGANMPGVTYDSVEGKFLVVIGYDAQHEGGDASARTLSLNYNGDPTWGTRITWHSGRVMYPYLAYSPTLGRHYASWRRQGGDGSNDHYGTVFSISGTNVTAGTNTQVSTDDYDGGFTSWDPNAGKFINVYLNSTDNTMRARAVTVSGMTPSFGAQSSVLTATNASGNNYFTISTTYDPTLKNVFAVFRDNYLGAYRQLTVSGTDIVLGTHGYIESGRNVDNMSVSFVAGVDKIAVAYQALYNAFSGGPNDTVTKIIDTSLKTTNLTTENFVGLSKAAYSDGNTAKVLTSGAIDESVTGLTPGQRYYVKGDGSLSTSPDVEVSSYAGQAVATNRMVVKDGWNITEPGILGYWEWGLCENQFKPWNSCGHYLGSFDKDCVASCNFATGKWYCQDCRYGDYHQGFDFTADIPDASGNNMCLCCGGYWVQNGGGTCCCSWTAACPDGRFGFPSVGLYCYDLNLMWAFDSCRAQGGCMILKMQYAGKKCRNTACPTFYCDVNGYLFNTNHCNFCDSRFEGHNVRLSGKIPVPNTDINFVAFRVHAQGIQHCLLNNGIYNCGNQVSQYGCYASKISFTKISNNPGYMYC